MIRHPATRRSDPLPRYAPDEWQAALGNLRRAGSLWQGPCPNCGEGTDRFHVNTEPPHLVHCRVCEADYATLARAAGLMPERQTGGSRGNDPEPPAVFDWQTAEYTAKAWLMRGIAERGGVTTRMVSSFWFVVRRPSASEPHPQHAKRGTGIPPSQRLPGRWKYTPQSGTVHHETGHAFVDEYLGTRTCTGSACSRSILEHWGVNEGIAKILESSVGGGEVEAPPASSTGEIFDDHCEMHSYPDGGRKCAHAIGNLVHEMYEELAENKGKDYARARYTEAVVALRNASVTVGKLHLQVAREIAELEDVHFEDPPGLEATTSFRTSDLLYLLEQLGIRKYAEDGPHYIPH